MEIKEEFIEARFPIYIETHGESVYFIVKGRLRRDDTVEITSYFIERGEKIYERPGDELEGWLIIIRERYSREEEQSDRGR